MPTIRDICRPTFSRNVAVNTIFFCVIFLFVVRLVVSTNELDGISRLRLDEFKGKSEEKDAVIFENISGGALKFFLDDTVEMPSGYIVKQRDKSVDIGPKIQDNKWKDFLKTYKAVLTITLLLLLLILLVPILGLLYCCFCLKCRGPCYKSGRKFQRMLYGLLLLLVLIGIVFGIVVAFICNDRMDDGFQKMPKAKIFTKAIPNELCAMLDDTAQHLNHLYEGNYVRMQNQIAKYRSGTSYANIYNYFTQTSNADSILKLRKMSQNLPTVPQHLNDLREMINHAKFIAEEFRDALRSVKRDITNTLFKMCSDSTRICKNFLHIQSIPSLDRGCLHYDLVPNITETMEAFKNISKRNFTEYIDDADAKLLQFKSSIKLVETNMLPDILDSLQRGAELLRSQTRTANQKLYNLSKEIKSQKVKPLPVNFKSLHEKMGTDRNTFNIVFCSILIVITVLLIIGLFLACLNSASFWMLIPIIVIFLTFSILTIFALYYFIMGLVLHRGVCMGSGKKLLFASNFDMASARSYTPIKGCEDNTSLYDGMKLENHFDLDSIRDYVMGNISDYVEKISKRIVPFRFEDFTLLHDNHAKELQDSFNTPSIKMFNLLDFTKIMCKELVPVALPTLATNLESLADKLHRVTEDIVIVALRNNAIHLRAYQKFLYVPLLSIINQIHDKIEQIKQLMIDADDQDFGMAVDKNIRNIEDLQASIRNNGEVVVKDMTNNISEFVRREMDNYIRNIRTTLDKNQIGSCKMLARSRIHSKSYDICKKIIQPMNNFWFGFLLSTLLLLPALFFAHKLRCLVRRNDDDYEDEDIEPRSLEPTTRNRDLYAPVSPAAFKPATSWEHSPILYSGGFPYDCHCPKNVNQNVYGKFQYELYGDPQSVQLNKRKTD